MGIEASVTRLGDFFNFLATNCISKVAPIFGDFLDSCEAIAFNDKLAMLHFGQLLEKFGLLFISASGHIGTDVLNKLNRRAAVSTLTK